MSRRGPRIDPLLRQILLAAVACVQWFLRQRARRRSADTRAAPGPAPAGAYEKLEGCRLDLSAGNDGDSFRVRHSRGVSVFRLYWVDTCETHPDFPDRIRHQARYFGIAESAVPRWGEAAREFSLGLLANRRFAVHTRWEPVMESGRFHAFVETEDGWLCERLVREGLARIFTLPSAAPDGTTEEVFGQRLRALEREARAAGRGAWGEGRR